MNDRHEELRIEYGDHDGVRRLLDVVRYCLEGISLDFDRWDERHTLGPGLYVAIVAAPTLSPYADPMGEERWPIERCRRIGPDVGPFSDVAHEVARTGDGAVVVGVDGVIEETMVRFRTPPNVAEDDRPEYAPWMGSRHMSALDTSIHPDVVGTVTLSAESGRVTTFRDGSYESTERELFASRWRGGDGDNGTEDGSGGYRNGRPKSDR